MDFKASGQAIAAGLAMASACMTVIAQERSVPRPLGTAGNKNTTFTLQNVRLPDFVQTVGKTWGINIIADAYLDDVQTVTLELPENPQPSEIVSVMQSVVAPLERQVYLINGVYVLRHKRQAVKVLQDVNSIQQSFKGWPDGGTIRVARARDGGNTRGEAGEPLFAQAKLLRFRYEAKGERKFELPGRFLSATIKEAPLSKISRSLFDVGGWTLDVSPKLGERRVSALLGNVSAGQTADALALLLNALPRTVMSQTGSQEELDAETLAPDIPRKKLSDALAERLKPHLTREQKDKIARQDAEVPIPFASLPPDVQDLARQYIEMTAPAGIPLDMNRLKECAIVFLPPPSIALGVNAFGRDGGRVHF